MCCKFSNCANELLRTGSQFNGDEGIGMLEYWSIRVLELNTNPNTITLRHSSTSTKLILPEHVLVVFNLETEFMLRFFYGKRLE